MIKKFALLIPACMVLAMAVFAAGGGASDPLVSLSYLVDSFKKELLETVDERLDESDEELLERIESDGTPVQSASVWAETRLKQGDRLIGTTGTNALLLAGGAQIVYDTGAVIDVTTGEEVSSGSSMIANHRYMVAEDTAAMFLTTSRTAVLDYLGAYRFAYDDDTVDYNAMAAALKELNLFKGSFTGYGQGFDLELAPTRLQALIMFIRVLGEEEEALAFEGACPFTDVPAWAERYAAYAYAKGYTKGTSATTFSDGPLYSNALLTFVLRALGYSDSAGDFTYNTAFVMAAEIGLISPGEFTNQSAVLLRSSCVQISYNALLTKVKGSDQTLIKTLVANGAVDQAKAEASGIFRSQRYFSRTSHGTHLLKSQGVISLQFPERRR